MLEAVDHIKPICEVVKVRGAGTRYDVPGSVAREAKRVDRIPAFICFPSYHL